MSNYRWSWHWEKEHHRRGGRKRLPWGSFGKQTHMRSTKGLGTVPWWLQRIQEIQVGSSHFCAFRRTVDGHTKLHTGNLRCVDCQARGCTDLIQEYPSQLLSEYHMAAQCHALTTLSYKGGIFLGTGWVAKFCYARLPGSNTFRYKQRSGSDSCLYRNIMNIVNSKVPTCISCKKWTFQQVMVIP